VVSRQPQETSDLAPARATRRHHRDPNQGDGSLGAVAPARINKHPRKLPTPRVRGKLEAVRGAAGKRGQKSKPMQAIRNPHYRIQVQVPSRWRAPFPPAAELHRPALTQHVCSTVHTCSEHGGRAAPADTWGFGYLVANLRLPRAGYVQVSGADDGTVGCRGGGVVDAPACPSRLFQPYGFPSRPHHMPIRGLGIQLGLAGAVVMSGAWRHRFPSPAAPPIACQPVRLRSTPSIPSS